MVTTERFPSQELQRKSENTGRTLKTFSPRHTIIRKRTIIDVTENETPISNMVEFSHISAATLTQSTDDLLTASSVVYHLLFQRSITISPTREEEEEKEEERNSQEKSLG
jgi:hypothetical protein